MQINLVNNRETFRSYYIKSLLRKSSFHLGLFGQWQQNIQQKYNFIVD